VTQTGEVPREPLARDPNCHYGEDAGIRAELLCSRDDGDPIDASHWLSQPGLLISPRPGSVGGYELPGDLVVAARVALNGAFAYSEELPFSLPLASISRRGALRSPKSRGQR
jgi:hypothetical protein